MAGYPLSTYGREKQERDHAAAKELHETNLAAQKRQHDERARFTVPKDQPASRTKKDAPPDPNDPWMKMMLKSVTEAREKKAAEAAKGQSAGTTQPSDVRRANAAALKKLPPGETLGYKETPFTPPKKQAAAPTFTMGQIAHYDESLTQRFFEFQEIVQGHPNEPDVKAARAVADKRFHDLFKIYQKSLQAAIAALEELGEPTNKAELALDAVHNGGKHVGAGEYGIASRCVRDAHVYRTDALLAIQIAAAQKAAINQIIADTLEQTKDACNLALVAYAGTLEFGVVKVLWVLAPTAEALAAKGFMKVAYNDNTDVSLKQILAKGLLDLAFLALGRLLDVKVFCNITPGLLSKVSIYSPATQEYIVKTLFNLESGIFKGFLASAADREYSNNKNETLKAQAAGKSVLESALVEFGLDNGGATMTAQVVAAAAGRK